jgi:hypothetical protein
LKPKDKGIEKQTKLNIEVEAFLQCPRSEADINVPEDNPIRYEKIIFKGQPEIIAPKKKKPKQKKII